MWLEKDEKGWAWRRTPGWVEGVMAVVAIPALGLALVVVLGVISLWGFPLHKLVWGDAPGTGLLRLPSAFQVLVVSGWLFVTVPAREFMRAVLALSEGLFTAPFRWLCVERVALSHEGLTRWRSFGPWRQERHARRQDVVDVDSGGMDGLQVVLASGERLRVAYPNAKGQGQAYRELPGLLQEVLGVPSETELLASRVPPGWQRRELSDGALALEPSRWRRGRDARWHIAMSVLFALGAVLVALRLGVEDEGRWGRLALMLGLGGIAVWDALRARSHLRGRCGLEVRPGAFVYIDRGLFRTHSTRYAPAALVVEREEDSEGSATYDLSVQGSKARRTLATSAPTDPLRPLLHLGHWLARNLGVPLQGAPAAPAREEGSRQQAPAPERDAG